MSALPHVEVAGVRSDLFGPNRRTTTVGLLLLVSMVAFEAMGVGTAMPALVADIGALSLYAWPFVAFMAAGVFGTVLGGRWCDVAGPRVPPFNRASRDPVPKPDIFCFRWHPPHSFFRTGATCF